MIAGRVQGAVGFSLRSLLKGWAGAGCLGWRTRAGSGVMRSREQAAWFLCAEYQVVAEISVKESAPFFSYSEGI